MNAPRAPALAPRKTKFDPIARYRDLEEELVRLKFERAGLLECDEMGALEDRRRRQEIESLRSFLVELRGDIEGTSGLKRKRNVLEVSKESLERDIEKMRPMLESVREDADRIMSERDAAEDAVGITAKDYKEAEDKGEELLRASERMKRATRDRCRQGVEITLRRDGAEDEVNQMRAKIEAIRAEVGELQTLMELAMEDAKKIGADMASIRSQNDLLKDKILMISNPGEFKKRKYEERKHKRRGRGVGLLKNIRPPMSSQLSLRSGLAGDLAGKISEDDDDNASVATGRYTVA